MTVSLVSGGAGFIGSHVTDELLRIGHEVVVLDDLSGGFIENVPKKAFFLNGSVCNARLVNKVFEDFQFDYVFHLAAYAAEGLSHFIKRFNYENNLVSSCAIINACVNHNVKRLVFTSSIAVYGELPSPMSEDMTPVPEDSYGIAKYAVEQEMRITHKMFGLPYTIFRPHNIYGERQNISDRYRNVVGIFMNQAMRGEPFTIFGDGEQQRAFSYVGDIAPIIAHSIYLDWARNETFNIGADQPYTVNALAMTVARAMGVDCTVNHLPPRNETAIAYCSHAKIEKHMGLMYPKCVPLEVGVGRMAEWVKKVGSREPTRFENIEIEKGLPPSWRTT